MRKILLIICALFSGQLLAEVSGALMLYSDYRLYGFSQTLEEPAVQLEVIYTTDNGFVFGTFLSNVDFVEDNDPGDLDATYELDLFASYEHAFNDDNVLALTLISYQYPGTNVELDYIEFIFDYISPVGTFTLGYSNDAFALDETGIRYEYSNEYTISEKMNFAFQLGYYDLDSVFDESYSYHDLGLTYSFEVVDLTVSYNGSSSKGEDLFGDAAKDTFVIGVTYGF